MSKDSYRQKEDYIFASGRVRVYEKRLIEARQMRQFLESSSFEEAMRLFRESSYGKSLDPGAGLAEAEQALRQERQRLFRDLEEAAPGSPVLQLISAQDRYHNLKVLVKEVLLGEEMDQLFVERGGVDLAYFENLLRYPAKNPEESLEEKALADLLRHFNEHQDLQVSEFILDRAMWAEMSAIAKDLDSPLISQWLEQQIDLYNLTVYWRMQKQGESETRLSQALAEGGSLNPEKLRQSFVQGELPATKNSDEANLIRLIKLMGEPDGASRLEKLRDEASIAFAKEARDVTYGPEVLFGYYLTREMEMTNLRILLISLASGLNEERRLERLRQLPR